MRGRTRIGVEQLEDRLVMDSGLGSATPDGITPAQMQHAYGFDRIGFLNGYFENAGSGQTIAIVVRGHDPNIADDLLAFDNDPHINLPAPRRFTVASVPGQTVPNADGDWGAETSFDVEWAHAMAPAASILLVECDGDMMAGVDYARRQPGVTVVSMSWEFGLARNVEHPEATSLDAHFPIFSQITYVASSGDGGLPVYPATSPNVLAVGGTEAVFDADNSFRSETAWDSSGGGVSHYEPRPGYQKADLSGTNRGTPDVAYVSTGYAFYDSYDYGTAKPWGQFEGTSAAAPQWAALIAIADQARAANGLAPLDGPTETLPLLYAPFNRSAFNDVTTGDNFVTDATNKVVSGSAAVAGYDLVTGLGTPKADQIVEALDRLFVADQTYGGRLYVQDGGNLWQYLPAQGWTQLDSNVRSFEPWPGTPYAYVLNNNGQLWMEAPGWQTNGRDWVDDNVRSFRWNTNTTLYVLGNDGNLWHEAIGWKDFGRTWVDGNARGFTYAAGGGGLYVLGTDGKLWLETEGWQTHGRTPVDSGLVALSQNDHGTVYTATVGNVVKVNSGSGFTTADRAFHTYAIDATGQLIVLQRTNGFIARTGFGQLLLEADPVGSAALNPVNVGTGSHGGVTVSGNGGLVEILPQATGYLFIEVRPGSRIPGFNVYALPANTYFQPG